ncbi:hypothetical protein COV81_05235 [Candidatus Peregrinibacteria bacterium CG11_big_fil_rev_8_21_14_0_20_41_10]|nr:MAG: hypothetical protein COV81_05235 [Candidatus Peregrinibacteria bacterium CG11_big_fil_rev_8_21_14_0_20_41_10]PIZ74669.1 MAG: hypothetical protein COY06_03830 [Candidatus Peregrinibacteria bacterium CG_4_10_14_0_2_um_filter_41_8]PJC38314.1 MAG: hypothetical protein CO045_00910 [Candidatus Peregrinibacteria bacterium CG_4_9_14_0_2_um_filter_41_14]
MQSRGFTLIEIMLVVVLVGIISGLTIAYTNSSITRANFQSAVNELQQDILVTQNYSRNNYMNVTSGIQFETNKYTLFHADLFDEEDPNNKVGNFSNELTFTEINIATPLYFAKYTGIPSASGNIMLTGANDKSATITISSSGVVSTNFN